MNIARVNQKNQINIPKEIAEKINFGPDRYVQVFVDNNTIHIIPISTEPLYSQESLKGLDRLVEKERDNAKEVRGAEGIKKIFKRPA